MAVTAARRTAPDATSRRTRRALRWLRQKSRFPWRYGPDERGFRPRPDATGSMPMMAIVGEGESAFLRILDSMGQGRRLVRGSNIVTPRDRETCDLRQNNIQYEDVNKLSVPDYSLLNHARYFSPFAMVYYSPTRGCYWNKCTFCDYGLNFNSPTSPWRWRNIDAVLADLTKISRVTKFVYFSVDVLAPAATVKIAKAIVAAKLDIRWAAEIRLESYLDADSCNILKESGCVAVSVGFESGCQRILDRIQKGTQLDRIEEIISNFSNAGIAVQMMGFTGFPTETFGEAVETIQFLHRTRSHWTIAALGDFVLTPGAIVAQQQARFGLLSKQRYWCENVP